MYCRGQFSAEPETVLKEVCAMSKTTQQTLCDNDDNDLCHSA